MGLFRHSGSRRPDGRDDCEVEVGRITVAVGPPLENTDLVVAPLHEAEADGALRVTVRGDAVPVAVDPRRARFVGRAPLFPSLDEGAGSPSGWQPPSWPKDSVRREAVLSRVLALSRLARERRPSRERYSRRRTASSASPRWRTRWHGSQMTRAGGT